MLFKSKLSKKFQESAASVLPIAIIVILLCFSIAPTPTDLMLSFIIGTGLLILGLGLFTFGVEKSMTLIGTYTGTRLTKFRKLWLILIISFILGIIITVAEPDLQVLADNAPHINTFVLIVTVSVGVGLFLMLCMLRIIMGIQLRWILMFFYAVVFILADFAVPDYISIAFDSGGVTTGPMTVPFIIAMGIGVASIRSDKNAEADSFGLVALCSIGPILAVLLLGFFYEGESSGITTSVIENYQNTSQIGLSYVEAIPKYMTEVAIALSPIVIFFLLFQVFVLKLRRLPFIRILIGLVFTYTGLVCFLLGVNVGFSPLGLILGTELGGGWTLYLLIPIAALMGWFIVSAEPAVHVLTKQVEEISSGAVSQKAMKVSLSIAISAAMALSMLRVITGIHIFYFLIPGYIISLALSFFVPQMFTAIAFDSGGVASGPMTATFMLPFAMGACQAVGGDILTDAFGLVALVAMTPLITIQVMGAVYVVKSRKNEQVKSPLYIYSDTEVIELWEEEECS
ncbi:MAG: DUF1538 domain-containing protein [Firmicutes bacterium]|nr:DUF1538 domain-containing protein [Bacillota bacterium]